MSFRHDGKDVNRWKRWLQTHREDLFRCGVSDSVLRTESDWLNFLEDLYDLKDG
jgi:hypothetical protein